MLARTNPLVRRLRALRKERKLRDEEGVFLAEGLHLAEEALRAAAEIETALVSSALDLVPGGRALRERLAASGARVEATSDELLDELQDARSPQPVLLVVRRPPQRLADALPGRDGLPLVVVAHGIQDPGNLGAIVRSADAAGATGFVATGKGADLFHPRAVRGTMGSVFRLPVAAADLPAALAAGRAIGLAIVATGAREGIPHTRFDFRRPAVVLLGAEGSGLPSLVEEEADARIRVPMRPGVESLSVGAAAAVVLFEAARQRGS